MIHITTTNRRILTSFNILRSAKIYHSMVTLRARRTDAPLPPAPPVVASQGKSIARHFTHQKSAASAANVRTANVNDKGLTDVKQDKSDKTNHKKRAVATAAGENSPRKRTATASASSSSNAKASQKSKTSASTLDEPELPLLSKEEISRATTVEYPRLPFDLHAAQAHLRNVDVRFHSMLDTIELKPYVEVADGRVRELDLFKTLVTSILGQQISWLAARAIVYKFVRLFHPELPEKPDFDNQPRETLPFPHPIDVVESDEPKLRSAGLSGAKVKYVKDIARRFSDGRLDARKIVTMDEEACIAELVQIKGVGRWTAEMLLMFALRRGDVLPVGDLGVQRGMVLFYTSDHAGPTVANKKRAKQEQKQLNDSQEAQQFKSPHDAEEKVPVVEEHLSESQVKVEHEIGDVEEHQLGPDIKVSSLNEEEKFNAGKLPALPDSITPSLLASRRDGKKAKGNVYLTASEMEALAAPWAPFRSLAVYMMWALVD